MKRANVLSAFRTIATFCGLIAVLPMLARAQASPFKDRAEYDAFTAIGAAANDPAKQAELAEKYMAAYPQSKVAENVLTMELQAYQKQSPPNVAKIEETANKLLQVNPKQIYALYVLSSLFPQTFNNTDPAADQKISAAMDHAKAGLDAVAALQKPATVSDDYWKKQADQLNGAFHQTLGFAALQKKDYGAAADELKKTAELSPNGAAGFYQLGIADLSQKPDTKYEQGIWALAHALSITGPTALPADAQTQVKDYLTKVYDARHGSTEGLDQIMSQAASAPFPPADFHIKTAEEAAPPAPEPVAAAPQPKRESTVKADDLSDWAAIQKYLQMGGEKSEDAWEILKGQHLPLPGKVVSATPATRPKTIRMAVSPDLQSQEGKYDVEVTLTAPYTKPIAKGQDIQVEGTVDAYTAKPFLVKLADAKVTN